MTDVTRSLMELAARRLEPHEREAVLGDLAETGADAWQGLLEVLGLVLRRHAAFWYDWRPWIAALGVAFPSAFLLMGVSFSISCTFQRLTGPQPCAACAPTAQEDSVLLLCQFVLLIIWSWAVGFVVGSVSRRTLWVSGALCMAPCLYCMTKFHETSLTRLCLLLFVPPAVMGAYRGLRTNDIKLNASVALATAVTVLMFCAWLAGALWNLNWALILPLWFIVIQAWRPDWWRTKSNFP